jgi:hypothetical protein
LAWAKDREYYYGFEAFIVDAFSTWFSYGLQRNTNAALLTATNYRIIAAIYYLGLFSNETYSRNDDVIAVILKRIPRIINIPAQFINDLIAVNEEVVVNLFKNGSSFHNYTIENRLRTLATALTILTNDSYVVDPGIIYNSTCRGAFISSNSVEISSIALEHPPTFVSMMYCVTQKGLQANTTLGRAITGIARKYDKAAFDRFIGSIAPLDE